MKKDLVAIGPLVATVLAITTGLFAALMFCFQTVRADLSLPPFVVQAPANISVTSIPTPTLPTRLRLVAPAFMVRAPSRPMTLTLDTTTFEGDATRLRLVYRADAQSSWRPVHLSQNARQEAQIPGPGDYAWVQLMPAAVPPAPSGAIVVDDVPPLFITYTYSTPQYWHIATVGGDYYGGHLH